MHMYVYVYVYTYIYVNVYMYIYIYIYHGSLLWTFSVRARADVVVYPEGKRGSLRE